MQLPAGLTARPMRLEDAAQVAVLINAEFALIGVTTHYTAEGVRKQWESPGEDIERNRLAIVDASDAVVAYAVIEPNGANPVQTWVNQTVAPDYRDQGIEPVLFAWLESRGETLVERCLPGARVVLNSSTNEKNTYRRRWFETQDDWREIRRFYRMRIDMDTLPDEVPLPDGFHYRTFRDDEHFVASVEVQNIAFRDHFGSVELPLADEVRDRLYYFRSDPNFDPELLFDVVETATDRVAGILWIVPVYPPEPDFAYVDEVAVLREFRGRGIAYAMLTHSLRTLYTKGRPRTVLFVDSDSPTGALRLYEKAGMYVEHIIVRYEKVLREGAPTES